MRFAPIPPALPGAALAAKHGQRLGGVEAGNAAYLSAAADSPPFPDATPRPEQIPPHVEPVEAVHVFDGATAMRGDSGHHLPRRSGRRDVNRPQLHAALAECRKRKATPLIARWDRLIRIVAFIANLMEGEVEFVAIPDPAAEEAASALAPLRRIKERRGYA